MVRPQPLALLLLAGACGALLPGHRGAPRALAPRAVLPSGLRRAPKPLALAGDSPEGHGGDGARLLVGGLAAAGALETGYLTATKLAGGSPGLCLDEAACRTVLDGPWSSVGGVPLSALGFGLYAVLFAAALLPLLARGRAAEETVAQLEGLSASVLQLGSTAAAVFSALLMSLLVTTIHAPCALCIGSAAISAAIFGTTWRSQIMGDRTAAAVYSAASAATTSAAALGAFVLVSSAAGPSSAGAEGGEGTLFLPPPIESHSDRTALELAGRLRAQNARMFGAYWCSHCLDQKEALGVEAFGQLSYVECAKEGAANDFKLCRQLGVPGYPTWQIGGKLFPGEKSVEELGRLLSDPAYAKEKEYVPQPKVQAGTAAAAAGSRSGGAA